jgi:hypothetical protein
VTTRYALTTQEAKRPPLSDPRRKSKFRTPREAYREIKTWPFDRRKRVKVLLQTSVEKVGEDGKRKKFKGVEKLDFDLWMGLVGVVDEVYPWHKVKKIVDEAEILFK